MQRTIRINMTANSISKTRLFFAGLFKVVIIDTATVKTFSVDDTIFTYLSGLSLRKAATVERMAVKNRHPAATHDKMNVAYHGMAAGLLSMSACVARGAEPCCADRIV